MAGLAPCPTPEGSSAWCTAPMGGENHHWAGNPLWALHLLPGSRLRLRQPGTRGWVCWFAGFPFLFQHVRSRGFCSQPQSSPTKRVCDVPAGTGHRRFLFTQCPRASKEDSDAVHMHPVMQPASNYANVCSFSSAQCPGFFQLLSWKFSASCGSCSVSPGEPPEPSQPRSRARLEGAPAPFGSLAVRAAQALLLPVLCLSAPSRPTRASAQAAARSCEKRGRAAAVAAAVSARPVQRRNRAQPRQACRESGRTRRA